VKPFTPGLVLEQVEHRFDADALFPVCLAVQLVGFDEQVAILIESVHDDTVSRDPVFDLQNIANADIFALLGLV